jgi:murein L,D-transpeptidase YafK
MNLVRIGMCCFIVFVAMAQVPGDAKVAGIGMADRVVVHKSDRLMRLYRGDDLLSQYPVRLGDNPVGHKTRRGDERTPEGIYSIDWRNPDSDFQLSLHISYPNANDRAQAAAQGVFPGGNIMIHGQPRDRGWPFFFRRFLDWTDGCIAIADTDMREIWDAVPDGTPIEIYP